MKLRVENISTELKENNEEKNIWIKNVKLENGFR